MLRGMSIVGGRGQVQGWSCCRERGVMGAWAGAGTGAGAGMIVLELNPLIHHGYLMASTRARWPLRHRNDVQTFFLPYLKNIRKTVWHGTILRGDCNIHPNYL